MLIQVEESDRCPETLTISQMWVVIGEHRCNRHKDHVGLHQCDVGVWATKRKLQSYIESEGSSV